MLMNAKNRSKVHLKNDHISISDSIEPARPSYLRKSLAWDDAFFTSAGVLDLNELTFINKGLNAADIEPRKHGAKSTINGKAAKMAELSAHNKMKIKRNSNNKTAIIPRSDKRDIKHISRSCDRFKSEDQSKSASWITYDVKKNNKAATNESAKHAMLCKKPFLGSISCDMSPGYHLSCPKTSSPKVRTPPSASYVTPTSAYPFAAPLIDRRSKLYASAASHSRSPLSQFKKEEIENFNNASAAEPGWIGLLEDAIQGSNLVNTTRRKSPFSMQSVEMNSPAVMKTKDTIDSSSNTTESNKRLKPSGLRQPLPTLGFFDEGKTASPTARLGMHFQMQKECTPPSIRKTPRNAKSTPVVASSNLKSQTNASHRVADICSRKTASQLKKQDDQKTVNKGKKTRIVSEKKEQNQQEQDKKAKSSAETEMEMQVNDLSRYFDIIDLSNESNVFNLCDNLPHARAPLVDKTTSVCNKVEESLAFSTKPTNVMLISKSSAKENSPAGL